MIKSEMIEVQRELKNETAKEIEEFVKIARKEGKKKMALTNEVSIGELKSLMKSKSS